MTNAKSSGFLRAALALFAVSLATPALALEKDLGGGRPAVAQVEAQKPEAGAPAEPTTKPTAIAKADDKRPSVIVLARDPSSPAKGNMLSEIAAERGVDLDFVLVDTMPADAIARKLAGRDLVLFDWAYDSGFQALLGKTRAALEDFDGKVWGGPMWQRADVTKGLTPEQAKRIFDYYRNGGAVNYARLFDYIKTKVYDQPGETPADPIIIPEAAIYHPDAPQKVFSSLADYLKWRAPRPGQKVVAIGFHQIEIGNDSLLHIDDLIHRLEQKGAFPLPFWDPNAGVKVLPLLTGRDGQILPDVLISFTGLYTTVDEQVKFAKVFDRPILQAITYGTGYEDEWRESEEGLPLFRMGVYYSLAEMAGRIDNTLVAAKRRSDEKLVAIPEQMDALAERALGQANLRHKPNKDKKLAILVWNSPEGEENFSASYLNIPTSIVEIVKSLRKEGYDAPEVDEATVIKNIKKLIRPYYRTKDDAELRKLVAEGLADRVPVSEYEAFIAATLPADVQKALAEGWEKPEDTYLTLKEGDRTDFVVPRWRLGNFLIMPQPLRGARRSEESDILHDKKRPMHHAFRAVYYDIVHKEKVDAIVHLGLHGTQEWALGKERAPSIHDDTQTTIGNVPVVYPYAAHGSGEAIIARRRGRAVTISHNEPPYAPSGLYGEIAELDELVHQYEGAAESALKEPLQRQILEKARKQNLVKEVGMSDAEIAADFGKFYRKLDKFMHTMAGMPQPLGFHTFGKLDDDDKTLLTILQILGPDYVKAWGEEPNDAYAKPYKDIENLPMFLALHRAVVENADLAQFPEKTRPFLVEARKHFANFTHPSELQNLAKALSGEFVPTSTGGDPLRNPEVVPTGRNLYTFDARKIPTKAAWEAGAKLGRDLMEKYKTEHGAYPDKVAFSLWQTETVLHLGVVEAEILYMLGVEPVWNGRGDVTGVKVIPRAELDRPRVDTILSLTGLYRDNLPELMNLLQGAVNNVAALKGEDNPVALNVQKTLEMLLAKGIDQDRAKRLARVRMFGNESGVYGTKLPQATVASGVWNKESTLADTYLERMSFIFGMEPDLHGVKIDGVNLYADALRGTKAAVLSRSNNAHGIVTLDHPFEYLGGIGLAVRQLDGKTPELYLSDLRNVRDFKNQSVAEFMSLELRSRMFHPRYVSELMNQGYAGATRMVDNLNNFWGWNVMDRSSVRADQWQEFYEVYIKDKYDLKLKDYFLKNHPAALAQLSERMLEAVRKGYWDAPEEVVRTLVATHEEIARMHDLHVSNEKFAEFVKVKAMGFGLLANAGAAAPPKAQEAPLAPPSAAVEQVKGVKLERQEAAQPRAPARQYELYALVFGSFGAGAAFELGRFWIRRRRAA